jgi:hydrogenase large subunit
MNRVEGDLEVRAEIDGGVVSEARCSGTMFRGFERIMIGRGPLDGLVITPRICGICSTSHLVAAVRVLDAIAGVTPPPDAVRIRNLAQMAEHIQSDVRHTFLMFAPDLAHPGFRSHALHEEAVRRYRPLAGETALEVIRATSKVLEIVAILGGQWPHTSFMVPGGVTSLPGSGDLLQCRHLLRHYREWYERRVLGCSIERWRSVRSRADLERWLEERPEHRESDLGFLLRYGRSLGLDMVGRGSGRFLSYGALDLPEGTRVEANGAEPRLYQSGLSNGSATTPFDPAAIREHVAHSWYLGDLASHPAKGETRPYASGEEAERYSWIKAPRLEGEAAETGPLAELVVGGDPLFLDLLAPGGASVLSRQLARLVRPAVMIPAMEVWLAEVTPDGSYYLASGEITEGEGVGLTHASRGALGHWVRIHEGAIAHYQIITPSAWNISPRDGQGTPGALEQALTGVRVMDPADPVELGLIVRSFDPCLVCAVHTVERGRALNPRRVGT